MKKGVVVTGIALLALAGFVGWRVMQKIGSGAGAGKSMRGNRTPTVELGVAKPALLVTEKEFLLSLESPLKVQLSPRVGGRIDEIKVREGDAVQAGQVLVQMDSSIQRAALAQAEANLAEAQSRLAQAKIQRSPTSAGVVGQISQSRAGLSGALADFNQTQQSAALTVANGEAAVADAEAKLSQADAQVLNFTAVLNRERANFVNARAKVARAESLLKQGFIPAQDLENAQTTAEVQANTVKVAEANLESAKLGRNSAAQQLRVSRNQLQIIKQKSKTDVEVAKSRVDQAKALKGVAEASSAQNPAFEENIHALEAAVEAARSQVAQARNNLSDASLKVPMNGTVTMRSADPGTFANAGTSILTVQQLDWLYGVCTLPVDESVGLSVGTPVSVTLDALPDKKIQATIESINESADLQTRQVALRVRFENGDRKLRPGMFGRLKLTKMRVEALVAVPKEAVTTKDDKSSVTVVGDDLVAKVRPVKIGATDGKMVQILEGLQAGEKIVTLTYQPIKDGTQVKLPSKGKGKGEKSSRGDEKGEKGEKK